MAIAFANVSIHSRAKGHSAVAGAAYRAGDSLVDARTGETHSFKNRTDVAYSSIMLPDGANPDFANREYLWNTVESYEKRGDSQVAKDYILALPRELSLEDNILLARNFAFSNFVVNGLVADIAIHDHGDGNPHAHIYVPTRRVLDNALSPRKARDLNPNFASGRGGKGFVTENEAWGEKWREHQNQFFLDKSIDLMVDENHLIAQKHEGRIRGNETHYIKEENALLRQASVEITLSQPEAVINALSSRYPTFNDKQIEKFIEKNTDTPEQREAALLDVMSHANLVYLGIGEDGRRAYTSSLNFMKEAEVAKISESLLMNKTSTPKPESLNAVIATYGLNSEQADALYNITCGDNIAAIIGRAGTGKSYMMRAANDVFRDMDISVYGMALSGIAADGLSQTGIASKTIAHYKKLIANNAWDLNRGDVIVMDEAGMTGLHDFHAILSFAKERQAKVVLVGDPEQLQAINSAPVFKSIVERIGFTELNQVMRQQKEGDRQATIMLSRGDIQNALNHYSVQGCVHLLREQIDADNALISHWQGSLKPGELKSQIIIAHTNQHVNELNLAARNALLADKQINENSNEYQNADGNILISKGERILIKQNNKSLGIKNGQLGTVTSLGDGTFSLKLDNSEKLVSINTKEFNRFDYGYAVTVHKSQGVTFDNVFVAAAGSGWDRFLTYVALSRHKHNVNIYASNESYESIKEMTTAFERNTILDSALNYPLMYAIRRGFDSDKVIGRFLSKITTAKQKIQYKWQYVRNYATKKQLDQHQEKINMQQHKNLSAIEVAVFADAHREVGKTWAELIQKNRGSNFASGLRYVNKDSKVNLLNSQLYLTLDKMVAKNRLGADLLDKYDSLGRAFELNHIEKTTLEKCRDKTALLSLLSQYLNAARLGKTCHQIRLAKLIKDYGISFYPELSYLSIKNNLDIKSVYKSINQNYKLANYYQLLKMASSSEKYALKKAKTYFELDNIRRTLWANAFKQGVEGNLSGNQKTYYANLQVKLDKLAADITQNSHAEKAVNCFSLDISKLKEQANRHGYRQDVKLYQSLQRGSTKEAFAEILLNDRAYYPYIFEANVDWKKLSKDRKTLEYKSLLKGLSKQERQSLQLLLKYNQSRIDTAKAFAGINQKNNISNNQHKTFALSLLNARNKLAFQVFSDLDRYAPLFDKAKIDIHNIEKHALQLHENLTKNSKKEKPFSKAVDKHKHIEKTLFNKNSNYQAISEALNNMGEQFYEQILGFQGRREGVNHIRFGQGHALVYAHHGDKAGSWHSFASDEGGGPLQLLMSSTHGYGLEFKEALKEGARIAGISYEQATEKLNTSKSQLQNKMPEKDKTQQLREKIKGAKYYYETAQTIEGTLGEKYLREHRKIEGDISAVKFHPQVRDIITLEDGKDVKSYHPAIVVAAKNEKGEITGSQTILLDSETGNKANESKVSVVKRSRGVLAGSAVQIQEGRSNQVIFAEGNETALSLIEAFPDANIYVTLGNIANITKLDWIAKKHNTNIFYVAADNDGHNTQSLLALKKAAQGLYNKNDITLRYSKPELGQAKKRDFNDLLREEGAMAVGVAADKWRSFSFDKQIQPLEPKELDEVLSKVNGLKEKSATNALLNSIDGFSKASSAHEKEKIATSIMKSVEQLSNICALNKILVNNKKLAKNIKYITKIIQQQKDRGIEL